ncbi:MAG: hypothetical protein K6U80_16365, partial [Firmicutes bacterium]|nr:hypothetical protein [Bacillota bacterium]
IREAPSFFILPLLSFFIFPHVESMLCLSYFRFRVPQNEPNRKMIKFSAFLEVFGIMPVGQNLTQKNAPIFHNYRYSRPVIFDVTEILKDWGISSFPFFSQGFLDLCRISFNIYKWGNDARINF